MQNTNVERETGARILKTSFFKPWYKNLVVWSRILTLLLLLALLSSIYFMSMIKNDLERLSNRFTSWKEIVDESPRIKGQGVPTFPGARVLGEGKLDDNGR